MGKESAETKNIKRYHPAPDEGLSPALWQQRVIEGQNNVDCTVSTRSVGRIVRDLSLIHIYPQHHQSVGDGESGDRDVGKRAV